MEKFLSTLNPRKLSDLPTYWLPSLHLTVEGLAEGRVVDEDPRVISPLQDAVRAFSAQVSMPDTGKGALVKGHHVLNGGWGGSYSAPQWAVPATWMLPSQATQWWHSARAQPNSRHSCTMPTQVPDIYMELLSMHSRGFTVKQNAPHGIWLQQRNFQRAVGTLPGGCNLEQWPLQSQGLVALVIVPVGAAGMNCLKLWPAVLAGTLRSVNN